MTRLSPVGIERLAAHRIEADALSALAELAELLDPDARLGRWELAGLVADRLRRFESTAWRRIARGGRTPQGATEAALARIAASGLPRVRRRIWDLLG